MTDTPKLISQLDPTRRARAQQSIQEALLVIVSGQSAPVFNPYSALNEVSESHRLMIVEGAEDADGNKGIMLAVEKAQAIIDPATMN